MICAVLPEDSSLTRNGLEIFPSRSTISWLLGGARGGGLRLEWTSFFEDYLV